MRSARCVHYAHMLTRRLDSGTQSSCLCHVTLVPHHTWGSLLRNSVCHTGSWRLLPWPMTARGCNPLRGCTLIPPVVWLHRGDCFRAVLLKRYSQLPAGLRLTLSLDCINWMLLRPHCLTQFCAWVQQQVCLSSSLSGNTGVSTSHSEILKQMLKEIIRLRNEPQFSET